MRYIGHYAAADTPAYSELAAASVPDRVANLTVLIGRVEAAGRRHTAALPDVHLLRKARLTHAEKKNLKDGYDHRSAAVKRLLERMRLSLPEEHLELCPYCSLDSTYQLDHFLPKSQYPEFSLYGPNLLPICGRCNQIKSKSIATNAGQRIFVIPSDDLFLREDLLLARLVMEPVPRFTFLVDPAAPLTEGERAQVKRHFDRLQLASRYRRRANALLKPLKTAVEKGGRRERIARKVILSGFRAAVSSGPNNGWELAMYRAIIRERHDFKRWLLG
jgi:5-methylcytosine-specific restriction endonuclease McrA